MKKRIIVSEYSNKNLNQSLCSHLQPVLDVLRENGALIADNGKMHADKGGAYTLKLKSKINFNLLRKEFDLPEFIELSEEYGSVICRRCWCDIEEA